MHIWRRVRSGGARLDHFGRASGAVARVLVLAVPGLVAGCASPGLPRAPSLNLPEVAGDLAAERVGDEVELRWTASPRNRDRLPLKGGVTAEICRVVLDPATNASVPPGTRAGQGASSATGSAPGPGSAPAPGVGGPPCAVAQRLTVQAGQTVEAQNTLPAELASGPVRVIAYRVQMRNEAGKTAGPSAAVLVASGPSPSPVQGMRGTDTKAGALLEWHAGSGNSLPQGAVDAVELDRITLAGTGATGAALNREETPVAPDPVVGSPAVGAPAAEAASAGRSSGMGKASRSPGSEARRTGNNPSRKREDAVKMRFRSGGTEPGGADAGGTVDRTAKLGQAYLYTATRVRTVVVDGKTLELRSVASSPVKVEMADIFPPDAPEGLVASPAFVRGASGTLDHAATAPAIDLSWLPSVETRVVGYRVYRRIANGGIANGGVGEGGAWVRLDAEPETVPAYRDAAVQADTSYEYRVTALDDAGHESAPGNVVMETAPAR
jgi:hypothetical protein